MWQHLTRFIEKNIGVRLNPVHHWNPHDIVGLSAFFFAVPAACFQAVAICLVREVPRPYKWLTFVQIVAYFTLWLQFSMCILTCAMADYFYKRKGHIAFWGKVDVCHAFTTFLMCVICFALRCSALETTLLVIMTGIAFSFSGLSKSFEQWVFRHTLWHVVGSGIAAYTALWQPPEAARIDDHIEVWLLCSGSLYTAVVLLSLLAYRLTPQEYRTALWNFGAKYANWQPAPPPVNRKESFDALLHA
mmetsp:Transcript_147109/g.273994  ORF Transcript_147109/g.273994 Transcript_147109/m.273994 type:complete len:246 (-) Transcript_147109:72-809(-)